MIFVHTQIPSLLVSFGRVKLKNGSVIFFQNTYVASNQRISCIDSLKYKSFSVTKVDLNLSSRGVCHCYTA